MFIKSKSVSFFRNAMTHAFVEAALKNNLNSKLDNTAADSFIKQRPRQVNDWTAMIHTRKNQSVVKALMA